MSLARKLAGRKPPAPPRYANPNVVPGIGGYRRALHKGQRRAAGTTYDGPAGGGAPRWGAGRQQAPFKPGKAERTRKLQRRTTPTPGSAERRNRRQYD